LTKKEASVKIPVCPAIRLGRHREKKEKPGSNKLGFFFASFFLSFAT